MNNMKKFKPILKINQGKTAEQRLSEINLDISEMTNKIIKQIKSHKINKNPNWGDVGSAAELASKLELVMLSLGIISEEQFKY